MAVVWAIFGSVNDLPACISTKHQEYFTSFAVVSHGAYVLHA